MNNSSVTNGTYHQLDILNFVVSIANIITGGSSAISNLIILLPLLFHKALRKKELLILLGLVIGDFIYGFGAFVSGINRMDLGLKNRHTTLVSPWSCQLQLTTFCFIFGPQISALMNVFLSVDRLLAVAWFRTYKTLHIPYVFGVTGFIFTCATISYFTGFIMAATMPSTPSVIALCLSTQASWPSYGTFYTTLIAVANCSSINVYSSVMIVLTYKLKQASSSMQDIQQKRQNKVTKTIGVIILADLLLDVLPWVVQTAVNASNLPSSVAKIVSPVTFVFIQCNRTVRVVIYLWKLKDMRNGVIEFFGRIIKRDNKVTPLRPTTAAEPYTTSRM